MPIDAPVAGLGLVGFFDDSVPEGLARTSAAERFCSHVFGAGGDSVIRDVGHGSAPNWLSWHCWHHRARRNNALIPNIGRLTFLREGESLHVVCAVRFD
jgi:hypothetical protein